MANFFHKVQSIGLIWKLLIPFLFLSFSLNGVMAYIGLNSQQKMIRQEERKEISNLYHLFMAKLEYMKRRALALATSISESPQVEVLLADQDKEALTQLMLPLYKTFKREFEIAQFHFHTPDGKSFLRLHLLDKFGEPLDYRKTILEAEKTGRGVAGLERGLAGLGIRGIAPIFHKGKLVGTVEIGYPFGSEFLEDLKLQWRPDFTVYEKVEEDKYLCLATTRKYCDELGLVRYLKASTEKEPTIVISPPSEPDKSFTLGPIRDYSKNVVALVKIEKDRSEIIARLNKTRNLMVVVGLAGIFVSFVVIWVVATQFTRPIREIVKMAQDIAEEKREIHLEPRPADEIGVLTKALNTMLGSLKSRRLQIEDYAKTLEKKVAERTADLISSEEKYRTLIEHLPLIVYRLLPDGTVVFINPYFKKKLGYRIEDVIPDKTFWWKNIYGLDETASEALLSKFGEDETEHRTERLVKDHEGNSLVFIDRMIAMKDEVGKIQWIDGIMVDITELKELQERALQTEEIKVLGEISARFAHEIRNPLVAVGGFARRLRDSLPKENKQYEIAKIIVEESSRLEQILRIMLASIKPFTLCISEFDLNDLLQSLIHELDDIIERKSIATEISFSQVLPRIQCDSALLGRAFGSLLKHAVLSTPEKEKFSLSTKPENDHVIVKIRLKEEGLSKEDLDQFFFPRFTNRDEKSSEELPLSRVIIHRHGGKIDVSGEGQDRVVINIDLPIRQHE